MGGLDGLRPQQHIVKGSLVRKMDAYENVIIGNFIYLLGITAGRQDQSTFNVNLLQQTPLDKPLADVMIASPRFVMIIEFKRASIVDKKEDEKRTKLREKLETKHKKLLLVSKLVHWFANIDCTNSTLGISIEPYIENQLSSKSYKEIPEFVNKIFEMSTKPKTLITAEEIKNYINLLGETGGTSKSRGGLIVIADKENGIAVIPLNDITEIAKSLKEMRHLEDVSDENYPNYSSPSYSGP